MAGSAFRGTGKIRSYLLTWLSLRKIPVENVESYCGLLCMGCPIFQATNEPDPTLREKMRIEIAKLSNKLYNTSHTTKDITDCDGCLHEDGRLFEGCRDCSIRNCARQKHIPNCAHCSEYICETLEMFFKDNPESKSRLDFIRAVL